MEKENEKPQITQITQIKKKQKSLRNLRNLWFQSIVSEANQVPNDFLQLP